MEKTIELDAEFCKDIEGRRCQFLRSKKNEPMVNGEPTARHYVIFSCDLFKKVDWDSCTREDECLAAGNTLTIQIGE